MGLMMLVMWGAIVVVVVVLVRGTGGWRAPAVPPPTEPDGLPFRRATGGEAAPLLTPRAPA